MPSPKYIKGMPSKEYYKLWRESHPGYSKKYGAKYFANAQKKHRVKNPDKVRLDRAKRRAMLSKSRVDKYIHKEQIRGWSTMECGICSMQIIGQYHIDHIIPLSKGGAHSVNNLQISHPYCNQSKYVTIII
jgi:5-methylcytosine-specific restriction endonuclease McrA